MDDMTADSDSEFGYDFSAEEEELLLQLAAPSSQSAVPRTQFQPAPVQPALFQPAPFQPVPVNRINLAAIDAVPDHAHAAQFDPFRRVASPAFSLDSLQTEYRVQDGPPTVSDFSTGSRQTVRYPDLSSALSRIEAEKQVQAKEEAQQTPVERLDPTGNDPFQDERSPLQRFRSYPRKPLTVTDLNSGAWCELQYWYTLTRLPGGRRTRTKAMKQGSKVHQKLEDEVHTTVKIDIMTREDGFGLKLWNFVQGLRTLRDTGLTRELEVWGMIDGNLVNGVIDGVSYENPNPDFEDELSSQGSRGKHQSSLTDYFPPSQEEQANRPGPRIYLTDVKTRGSLAPVGKALLRPAKIQLLLYHRFLSDMAAGRLDMLKVFRRYGLDPDDPFSDAFIAQIGSLHDEIFVDARSSSQADLSTESTREPASSSSQTSADTAGPDLLRYRTLRELLPLVEQELNVTFPHGEHSLGHMLRVQYVHRDDGREIDLHDFPVSRQALDDYLTRYMAWWRGERQAVGVDIEEAFKCRTCEFVSDCSWRQGLDDERLRKAQEKVQARRARPG